MMYRRFSLRFSVLFLSLIVHALVLRAGEGMWLPMFLKSLNEAEMKSMGMKMSAEDIYSVNAGSLKDAVVHFNGGCTAGVVSSQGLILTNHHCGYGAIQSHSTMEDNIMQHGFWAENQDAELPNPGYYAQFIIRIDDVTDAALQGVTSTMEWSQRKSIVDKNISSIIANTARESYQEVTVKSYFEDNQYFAIVTETYRDVRLVGTPPESIGKFGADTDNWVWPRHTGDFAVFRIYASRDNKPAEYSPDNKPLRPRNFFPVSLDGVAEGDFTLVFGFPGKTQQYLPSYAIQQTIDIVDPTRIGVRDISLGIMDKYMRQDPAVRLSYSVKYASLSNSWKKWIGELEGLISKDAVAKKQKQEVQFVEAIRDQPELQRMYGDILPRLQTLYAQLGPILHDRILLSEIGGGSNVELFKLAGYADQVVKAYQNNGEAGYATAVGRMQNGLPGFFEDYSANIDREIFEALMTHLIQSLVSSQSPEAWSKAKYMSDPSIVKKAANSIYTTSFLVSETKWMAALDQPGDVFVATAEKDPAYQLYLEWKAVMDKQNTPAYSKINDEIMLLQKTYMQAMMKADPKRRWWPDANSTLRVTYGQVEKYAPRDGMEYKTQTYLEGVMEKYKPGDYEFDVPQRLIDLYEKKDYGPYASNGKLPVAFIASNHTTGGNSGSPAVDAYGNLIGLNFDRVWEGTMSDLYYDRSICRNIMVDVRYILFMMDKYAGATHLVNEMELVHPKAKAPKRKKK